MKKSVWKKAKLSILKVIGQNNANRLSLMQKEVGTRILRLIRKLNGGDQQNYSCTVNKFSVGNQQTFFGYYDVTPFSRDNDLLLAMTSPIENRPPAPDDELEIGYFKYKESKEFHSLGASSTWCWQQGCRLRWFPTDENNLILYNKLVKGSYGSVVQNIKTREIIKEFDCPIYDIDRNGEYALTLNFSRLGRLRPGYGYSNLPDETANQKAPEEDGVWLLNLNDGDKKLLFSLYDLSKLEHESSMDDAEHYVNHISISPYDDMFMCFHLWTKDDVIYNRLLICQMNGEELKIIKADGTFSHYTWTSAYELLTTIFYNRERSEYVQYDLRTMTGTKVGDGKLVVDGHPTWSPDRKILLTDTYPDKFSEQSVITYSFSDGPVIVQKLPTPVVLGYKHGGQLRCDLHPRWDREGSYICIDSAAGGKRSLYVLEIKSGV